MTLSGYTSWSCGTNALATVNVGSSLDSLKMRFAVAVNSGGDHGHANPGRLGGGCDDLFVATFRRGHDVDSESPGVDVGDVGGLPTPAIREEAVRLRSGEGRSASSIAAIRTPGTGKGGGRSLGERPRAWTSVLAPDSAVSGRIRHPVRGSNRIRPTTSLPSAREGSRHRPGDGCVRVRESSKKAQGASRP